MTKNKAGVEEVLKYLNFFMFGSLIIGGIVSLFLKGGLGITSFVLGWLIGFLNFRSTKKDGIGTIERVVEGLSPEKGAFLYIAKFFLRLFATGVILFVGLALLKLNVYYIVAGISVVYLQVFLGSIYSFYIKKLEIV
ncbi:MAG: hypothetical protein GXO57_03440 [Thermodesulfobacteria bacterium]|nr:hypothetical protein [Thermodesulfobacteriota bacterium]